MTDILQMDGLTDGRTARKLFALVHLTMPGSHVASLVTFSPVV